MSDSLSTLQEVRGHKRRPWTYGTPWASHAAYWGPPEPWRSPYYGPYGLAWRAPPVEPAPNYNYKID
jgi:hypothetical protein